MLGNGRISEDVGEMGDTGDTGEKILVLLGPGSEDEADTVDISWDPARG
jgi:hypothetical protein